MISGIFIALMFVILVYSFEVFKKVRTTKIISTFIGVLIFYGLLFNITDNSDWENYEVYFNGYNETTDFLFSYISDVFSNNGYDYIAVYKFHILIMGIGFIYFASRFSFSNVFAVISCYLLFQFVPLSNQIRYYVAFTFFLISIYSLIVTKNKISFAIFAILSVLSHSAILLMYPFLYFYYKKNQKNYILNFFIFSFVFAGFFFAIYSYFLDSLSHFETYFEKESLSSLAGGVFSSFIWALWSIYLIYKNKRIELNFLDTVKKDVKYQFLYKLSLYSIIFYPMSLFLQIFRERYIMALFIVWVSFIFYSLNYEDSSHKRFSAISQFLVLIVITFLYVYFLPTYLIGISGTELTEQLIKANPDLVFLLQ